MKKKYEKAAVAKREKLENITAGKSAVSGLKPDVT